MGTYRVSGETPELGPERLRQDILQNQRRRRGDLREHARLRDEN